MESKNPANRLINEKSPYLLQHAYNPVEWYPWSDEAFLKAKDEDKPIFLSIGYSTCHWCHVMEKESFEDDAVAKLLNEHFINIKVDREELPEVDGLYMEFAQAIMPGGGGWPLNVVLTPELEPFFATTYIPPESGRGFIGFKELIIRLSELWKDPEEKEKLIEQASKVLEVFKAQLTEKGSEIPLKEEVHNAAELLFHMEDPVWGGVKGEPKFPMGYHCCFLLNYAKLANDSRALFCVELTLDMMHRGGIYDHLGGGFSRYCIDAKWQIPHFEKMLYDNAILARAYIEAFLYTKKVFYKEVAEEVLAYVLRDMSSPKGGFYSAKDADSEGEEGRFYTWTYDEIKSALEPMDAKLFLEFYGVTKEGNFEGRNILHTRVRLEEFVEKRHLELQQTKASLIEAKERLRNEREKREPLSKDDKILTSWNGLMINTLVMAASAFGEEKYLKQARTALQFIKTNLWKKDHLLRRWRDNEARFDAGLDEYAFLIQSTLTLFEVEGKLEDLQFAIQMTHILESEFKSENGAFYLNDGKDPNIVLRRCEFYDGAEPSGNGVHCENLLRLYQITFNEHYLRQAEDVLKAAKKHIDHHPAGCCYSLMALNRYWNHNSATIVVSLNRNREYEKDIKNILSDKYLPHHVIIWRSEGQPYDELIPHLVEKVPIQDKTTLYICQRGECKAPIHEWDNIALTLQAL